MLVVPWVLLQIRAASSPASWDGGVPVREDFGPVFFLGVGGNQLLMGWEVGGCCCRLRSSEMSGMSRSSGACLPVSLAFVSGMHVFPRGHLMPVGQV